MSTSGITVYNTNKALVLDENYQNFYLTETGTAEPAYLDSTTGYRATKYEGTIARNPLRIDGTETSEQRRLPYEIMLSNNEKIVAVGCSSSNLYKTYTFKNEPQTAAAHGTGLQVFNSAGKCIYDSTWKRLRILNFGSGGYKLPTDRELAIVTCSVNWETGIIPGNNTQGGWIIYGISAVVPENGYTKLKNYVYRGAPIGGSYWDGLPRPAACMVIDVTGY
ncbi:hypothetical protein [Acidaminococcus massiliensis]|uniref:hypothetical protein n=1 Tax=Acidaminococcus massiliensis TaxID=1852375 RepID=UPI00094E48C5|nr:hypothetical protein [Acidaminococcus massiliensis]